MSRLDPFSADNLDHSVRISFKHSLPPTFSPLVNWFVNEIVRSADNVAVRPSSRTQVFEIVSCILANFIVCRRIDPKCFLAISLGSNDFKQGRYNKRGIGYTNFKRTIDFLRASDQAFIDFFNAFNDRARRKSRTTRIRPTSKLNRILEGYQAIIEGGVRQLAGRNMLDVVAELIAQDRRPEREIPLRRLVTRVVASDAIRLRDAKKKNINYTDSELTNGMRGRLENWNAFIDANFHIDLLVPDAELSKVMNRRNENGEYDGEIFYGDKQEDTHFVDFTRNHLHRVFNNGSFDLGGRFYGAWWQAVPSRYRRHLMINGAPTIEVDYSGLHPMMLYAEEKVPFPNDPYEIEGLDPTAHRKLIKGTLLRLINALPRQRILPPEDETLPDGWTWGQLQDAVREKHTPIARHFRSGAGLRLQRKDADIAERVMLKFQEADYPILPVHDSFVTYRGLHDMLTYEMHAAYRAVIGSEIRVAPKYSFLDTLEIPNTPLRYQPDAEFWVEGWINDPAYAGYKSRLEDFLSTRTAEWHRRFGEERDFHGSKPLRWYPPAIPARWFAPASGWSGIDSAKASGKADTGHH